MIGNSKYQTGEFDYSDCRDHGFAALGTTDEKAMTALTLSALARSLADQKVIFGTGQPIHLVEAGIGDSSSTKRYIEALGPVHKAGFVFHGSDPNQDWLKEIRTNLGSMPGANLSIGSLKKADAFKGDVLTDTPGQVFLGAHFIYSAKYRNNHIQDSAEKDAAINQEITTFLQTAIGSLDPKGIAILYHDGKGSEIYGKEGIGGKYGDSMTDAPERLADMARKLELKVTTVSVPSREEFPQLDDETIDRFKKLENWKDFPPDSDEAMWLKKFLFALDRHRIVASDGEVISQGGVMDLKPEELAKAIEGTKKVLRRTGGYIPMLAQMQIIYKDDSLTPAIEKAAEEVRQQMESIQAEAYALMKDPYKDDYRAKEKFRNDPAEQERVRKKIQRGLSSFDFGPVFQRPPEELQTAGRKQRALLGNLSTIVSATDREFAIARANENVGAFIKEHAACLREFAGALRQYKNNDRRYNLSYKGRYQYDSFMDEYIKLLEDAIKEFKAIADNTHKNRSSTMLDKWTNDSTLCTKLDDALRLASVDERSNDLRVDNNAELLKKIQKTHEAFAPVKSALETIIKQKAEDSSKGLRWA